MLDKRKTTNFFGSSDYEERLKEYIVNGDCWPLDAVIHLTNYCQHKCDFCYNSIIPELGKTDPIHKIRLDSDFTIKLIDDLVLNGVKKILLSGGGEPLLHSDIKEILDSLIGKVSSNSVYTNLDIDISKLENVLSKLDNINININTTDDKLYRQTRGAGANLGRVKENIYGLLNNDAHLTATIIVRDNTIQTLKKSLEELSYLGITSIVVSPAFSLDYEDGIKMSTRSIQKLEEIKNVVNNKDIRILEPERKSLRDYSGKVFCKSHYFDITIGADYGVYPCCNTAYLPDYKIFDLRKYATFYDGWNSVERKNWIQSNNVDCQTCWFTPLNNMIVDLERK